MGRKKKISSEEVRETLENNGVLTVEKLAGMHDVTPVTIRKRIKELREGGLAILPTNKGMLYLDPRNGMTEEQADLTYKTGNWIIAEIVGLSKIGEISKKPLVQVRKIISLNKDEIKTLRKNIALIGSLVSTMDAERELLEIEKE